MWHQHQPLYPKDENGVVTRPWVRLHAAKDYWDMAALVERLSGSAHHLQPDPGPPSTTRRDPRRNTRYLLGAHGGPGRRTDRRAEGLSSSPGSSTSTRGSLPASPATRNSPTSAPRRRVLDPGLPRPPGPVQPCMDRSRPARRNPGLSALVAQGRDFVDADKEPVLGELISMRSRRRSTSTQKLWAEGQIEVTTTPSPIPSCR